MSQLQLRISSTGDSSDDLLLGDNGPQKGAQLQLECLCEPRVTRKRLVGPFKAETPHALNINHLSWNFLRVYNARIVKERRV